MLQVIKAKVNGQDGYIATYAVNGRPESVAFVKKEEILALLVNL